MALAVALSFYALSRIGGASAIHAYLYIGYFLSDVLPEPLVTWLDGPDMGGGIIAVTILSFLSWWLVLIAITFGARAYFNKRT